METAVKFSTVLIVFQVWKKYLHKKSARKLVNPLIGCYIKPNGDLNVPRYFTFLVIIRKFPAMEQKKMKKFILFAAAALLLCAGCATARNTPAASSPKYTGKTLKAGFYVDKGSQGGGVLHLARLLYHSPQISELKLLKGEDLVKGKLKGLDLLVMPGGSSKTQMVSMTPAGVKELQNYVKNGGAYVGICAGYHISLNRPERAQLLPYTYYQEAVGYKGDVLVEFTPEAQKMLGITTKKAFTRYSRGPISKVAKWDKGTCKTLAVYKSSVSPLNRPGKSFVGTPAAICGTYGKGKVIATSFHPEYRPDTHHIFGGLVYAVTGVKLTPELPVPEFRPVHVAYSTSSGMALSTIKAIEDILTIEENTKLQLHLGLTRDNLAIADVLVLPDTTEKAAKGFVKNDWLPVIRQFMDRNRKVIVVGPKWTNIPNHKNLIRVPAGSALDKAVLKACGK